MPGTWGSPELLTCDEYDPYTTVSRVPKDHKHPSTDKTGQNHLFPCYSRPRKFRPTQLDRPLCCSCLGVEITSTWLPIPLVNSHT